MSTDDFLEFDDEGTSGGSSSRQPFLILAGVLVTVLILASICTIYVFSNRSQDGGTALQTREAENATAIALNAAVTQTIIAMETEAAQPPTETPEPPATDTPEATPTDTPAPTETPVVSQNGEEQPETAEGEGETGEGTTAETETGTETGADTDDETPATGVVSGDGTDDNGRSEPALGTGSSEAALPQTGLETWSAILVGLFLIGIVIVARRLRHS